MSKIISVITILFFAVLIPIASTTTELQLSSSFAKSESTNGIYVVVTGKLNPVNGAKDYYLKSSEALVYKFFTTADNAIKVAFPTDRKFRFKVELFDALNTRIPKTKKGSEYGTKFDRLAKYEDGTMGTATAESGPITIESFSGGCVIPSVSELFALDKPGIYWLKIQFQAFRMEPDHNLTLVRIPPVELSVVHK